jgi:hypothetical protein
VNEIDILTNAGLSRTTAEMVVALHTLATTIGLIAAQQQAGPPDQTDTAPEGGDADEHE